MNAPKRLCSSLFTLVLTSAFAQAPITDSEQFSRVRNEALERSAVGKYAFFLTDVYGPRLSGSPSYRKSAEWVRTALEGLGMDKVEYHSAISAEWTEPGWTYGRFGVSLLEPTMANLTAIPSPYSPPTRGRLTGEPVPRHDFLHRRCASYLHLNHRRRQNPSPPERRPLRDRASKSMRIGANCSAFSKKRAPWHS